MKKRTFSKVLSLVLALCMILQSAVTPITVNAAGTAKAANVIMSAEQLPAEIPAGTVYELGADITLAAGQQIASVAGTLDGKGFTVTLADKPLAVKVTGTIQNLGVTGTTQIKGDAVGTMAEQLMDGSILNSFSTAPMKSSFSDLGGLAGVSEGGILRNSFYGGKIEGMMFGGLVGKTINKEKPTTITECYYASGDAVGGNLPVSQGTAYNKEEGRFALKSVAEMKKAGFAALLNKEIKDTGYVWKAAEGSLPVLEAVVVPEQPGAVNKDALKAKIDEVKALNKADYVAETWEAVETALTEAEKVLADEAADKKAVDAALEALTTAVEGLLKEIPTKAVKLPAADEIIPISSVSDLQQIGTGEGNYYQLTQDISIDLMDFYTPADVFNGVFDGNGKTITIGSDSMVGLFKTIGRDGVVQNVQFAGSLKEGLTVAPAGNTLYGAVINCISTVKGKDATGLVKAVSGGVISNCVSYGKAGKGGLIARYGDDNYETNPVSKYTGKIYNSYWIAGSKEPSIASDDLLDGAGSRKEENMKKKEVVNALNAKRGENGIAWGQNGKTGFPYFGADQDYDPNNIDLPDSKYTVKFGRTLETAKVVTGKRLDVSKNDFYEGDNGVIGQFFLFDGEKQIPSEDIAWSVYDVKNDAIDINKQTGNEKNGRLHLFKDGEGVVKAQVRGEDAVWVKVFSETKPIEDFKVFMKDTDVTDGKAVLQGSEQGRFELKAKYAGSEEYVHVFTGVFGFTYSDDEMVKNEGRASFNFNQPGTASVTIAPYSNESLKKTVELKSEFVPIASIEPDLSTENILHARASMLDGRTFDAIETNGVIISPSNASNKKGFNVTSSDTTVAQFTPTLPLGYLPFKAGTTVLTATIVDKDPTSDYEKTLTGERTVTFKYRNPLTEVIANETKVDVKEFTTTPLNLSFKGENSKDGWSVSEPDLNWTFEGNGKVKIKREKLHKQNRDENAPEGEKGYWIATTDYIVEGLKAGTVIATGTPVDTTNKVEPVKILIEVTPGEAVHIDIPALVNQGKKTALDALRKKHEGKGYIYSDEWDVYAILRAGGTLTQEEIDGYYASVEEKVKKWRPTQKPTDMEKVAITLSLLGKDPKNVGGVNIIDMITNSKFLRNGSNELSWGLLALEATNTDGAEGALWNRDKMISELLSWQLDNGGFPLFKGMNADIDMTAMIIQALARYNNRPEVKAAIEKGLDFLSKKYSVNMTTGTSEADAQILIALSSLGIDPVTDERFSTARENLITTLMSYHVEGEGFSHIRKEQVTDMSNVQVYQALTAYERFVNNESTYYDVQNIGKEPAGHKPEPEKPEPEVKPEPEKPAPEKPAVKPAVTLKVSHAADTDSVKLTWKKISGVKGYNVYRYDTKTKKYRLIAKLSAGKTSYTVKRLDGSKGKKLSAGKAYRFAVRPYKVVNGKTVYGKATVVTTATRPEKTAVTSLKKAGSRKIRISWKKVKGVSGYRVYMKSSKKGDYKLVKDLKKSSSVKYTKAKLKKHKTYTFRVRTYKVINGKKVYSTLSKEKKLKLK